MVTSAGQKRLMPFWSIWKRRRVEFSVAPKSGFHKLAERRQYGSRSGCGSLPRSHRSATKPMPGHLGFELHDGDASRLVTSCACSPEIDIAFRAAVRRTSAHSTLDFRRRYGLVSRFAINEDTRLLYPVKARKAFQPSGLRKIPRYGSTRNMADTNNRIRICCTAADFVHVG